MIRLRKLNGSNFVLNCELIETLEHTPDTIITTVSGKKLVVADTVEEIVEKVLQYKRNIYISSFRPD